MKEYTSNLQTLLGSFHADIWEVEDVMPYIESLDEVSKESLYQEMKYFLDEKLVNKKFMRNFISDSFVSDDGAKIFFEKVMKACFHDESMPDIDDYI